MEFEAVIGLEVHAQLLTNTKLFCGCTSIFGDEANIHGCPVCLGMPGSLPVLNRRVVELAVRMGLATGCKISHKSIFARKNYFYPDLPKGYQISQYDLPLCHNGMLRITTASASRDIRIRRIHLEEDAGKLIHDQSAQSLFDVNRCGTPLIEIVTDPDLRTSAEAYAYLMSIKQILQYLLICDCNMEEGSLRCDANISIRPKGETKLGTKAELKNMNSFRNVEKAIDYEIVRQKKVVEGGGKVEQQTFLWDADKNRTNAMRSKEEENDYRYFPDPDLVPLIVTNDYIDSIGSSLPELPANKRTRFVEMFGITEYMADSLTETQVLADYFEATVKVCGDAKLVANWIMTDVLRILGEKKIDLAVCKISSQRLGDLLNLIVKGTISGTAAKKVFDAIEEQDKEPATLVQELGLTQISDTSELQKLVQGVLDANPAELARYKGGDKKLTGFFIGQVMKATKGKGNPQEINRIFTQLTGV